MGWARIRTATNFTDTHPLIIDTQARTEDIQPAAHQRIRAATDLLETFSCLTFEHADLKDISHLTNALYLLVRDGCDLLEAAQHVQLQPAQPNLSDTLCRSELARENPQR